MMAFDDDLAEMAADIAAELGIDVAFNKRDRVVGAGGAVTDTPAFATVKGVPSGEVVFERGTAGGGSKRIAQMTVQIAAAVLPVGIEPKDTVTIAGLIYSITQIAEEAQGTIVVLTVVRDA